MLRQPLRATRLLIVLPQLTVGCVCRCRQLMDIWPSFRWLKVVSQPWEGDVTMVLPSSFVQIAKAITNPSMEDLKDACLQARTLSRLTAAASI